MTYPIEKIIKILQKEFKNSNAPVKNLIALNQKNPFKILLSTIISLRTKDEITIESSKKLFTILKTPNDIHNITTKQIQDAIYPCGFYRRKAIQIKQICTQLAEDFNSKVPNNINTLLQFKGIGRKTANLILSQGFNIPAICVDVHVHRISNRLGFIKTNTPNQTEQQLNKHLPKKYWIEYNTLLVAFGQTICTPINPFCSKCPISNHCKKINVNQNKSR